MWSAPARRLLVVLSALLVVIVGAPVGLAAAEAPFRLPTQVVDPANALTETQRTDVEKVIADVADGEDIALWVVYVKNFGGMTPQAWTAQTVAQTSVGARDVVIAVATDERRAYMVAPLEVEGLSEDEVATITKDNLMPAVRDGKFAEAAIDTGDAVEAAAADTSSSRVWILVAAAAVVIAVIVLLWWLRRRRADESTEADDAYTADELEQQPLDVLDPWSQEVLTDTDRAIATSADELALAVAELGEETAQPFTDAVVDARAALAEAFTLRQRIDDGEVTDPAEHRRLLVQIITTCSDADASLDRQVTEFDALRDLVSDADARLAALTARITEVADRVPAAQARIDALTDEFGTAAASVADNAALAGVHLQFAQDATEQGRDATASRGSVVGAIRSAEGALDQAVKLLDAVDDADPGNVGAADLPAVFDRVRAVSDYVHTRRGVVGSVARTRLSEARRLADEAADLAGQNPGASATAAERASALADVALAAAQRDVADWFDAQQTPDGEDGYGDLAPVLTGILVDTVLSETPHSGGYSHDGRSPASYGGSSSSGRIGVGGRG